MNNRDREILTRLLEKYDKLDERERALQKDFAQIKETVSWIQRTLEHQVNEARFQARWKLTLLALFSSTIFSLINLILRVIG